MKRRALIFPVHLAFLAAAISVAGCEKSYTSDAPVLDRPVSELDDEEIARMSVVIETNYGKIRIKMRPDWAPKTCRHFIKLVKQGLYDGLTFHEIRPRQWIRGGNPQGAGLGLIDETIPLESPTGPNKRGAVGLYHHSAMPDMGSTQFYIILRRLAVMDGYYAVFGEVIQGMAVVDRIADLPLTPEGGKPREYMPLDEVVMKNVYLEAKE